MIRNSTKKIISRQELLNNQELSNFSNYIMDRYSPNIIQNDCLIKTHEFDTKYTIEFVFNQKYGYDVVDLIYEPIMIYNLTNDTDKPNPINLFPILEPNDIIELIFNNKILETMSFSTLLARLKLTSSQITTTNTKYMFPLNFGILMSGFIVDIGNQGILKININIAKSQSRQINLMDYMNFQLKYKSYLIAEYKIKNSSNTLKLLNHYYSHPTNKKLLEEPVSDSIKNKIIIEPDIKLQPIQSTQSIPVYKTSFSDSNANIKMTTDRNYMTQHNQLNSLYNSTPASQQNYSNIVNSLYNQMAKEGYENTQSFEPFDPTEDFGEIYGFNQNLIDYEFNDEIEEYKKIDTLPSSQYFQKEKLFNKKVSFFCDIVSEIECQSITNKSISFQASSLTNLYFYSNTDNGTNLFDSLRLRLNGKTIYESEREIMLLNCDESFQLYFIPINTTKTNILDTYELIFDGLTQPVNKLEIKLFEISKYMSCYSTSNNSPNLIKV